MKILHFSDTHLGFSDLEVLSNDNINQREADFYDAFEQVVTSIQTLRPDYIIHTGDLFHRSSPSNRAITFALKQFKIINDLAIPCIMIAGNHSTPRTQLSSPILKIFEDYQNIYLSYEQCYKKIEFSDVIFHTLPHMNDDTKALDEIDKIESHIDTEKKNIMMMHCSVGGNYLMEEFGEWVFPKQKEYLFEKMDYVALGHWHGFGSVGKHPNVYYSGSTERTSLNDKRNSKGFIVATLGESLDVEYKEISIRKVCTKEIDCRSFEESLEHIDTSDTKDSIVEVKLLNLTPLQSIDISNKQIKDLFSEALDVSISRRFVSQESSESLEAIEALSLQEYFLEHLKAESDAKEFERLKNKVDALFYEYEEQENDSL
ncbi:MAG: DNA repair exonuclease [Helicobacteraceae bacterium]|nr:DNA repair exonuclease [Helicobacteraceae bacterium]